MASVVRLELGLKEFMQELRDLPPHLKARARPIVRSRADGAAAKIITAYPEGPTGNLKRGVTVEHNSDQFATGAIVKSRAKHAWMFENGTQVRHNGLGANRGAMPPGKVFIPIAIRERRGMVEELIDMVQSEGFQVSGAL